MRPSWPEDAALRAPMDETPDLKAPLLTPTSDTPSVSSPVKMRVAVLFALAAMIVGTVVQSEASQALQSKGQFNKPFFITCVNHTLGGVLLPMLALYHNLRTTGTDGWVSLHTVVRLHSVLPLDRLVGVAVFVSVASLVADYFWYAALAGVSVTAANAISNCSPLFVYCFSICLLGERLELRKIGGVLVAFVGVTFIVMYQDVRTRFDVETVWTIGVHDASVLAGLLVVVSSVFYAGYQVVFKYLVGVDLTDASTVLLVTALSGVFTVPLWVVGSVAVAHNPIASLREPFGLPTTSEGWALLALSGSLAVVVNLSMPLVLCWTTPLETSVGAMLVVPLAGVWDVVFHHTHFSAECIFGSVLVLVGFGLLEYKRAMPPGEASDSDTQTETSSQIDAEGAEVAVLLPVRGTDPAIARKHAHANA